MADDLVNRTIATTMIDFRPGYVECMAKKNVEFFWLKKCIETNQGGRAVEWRARLSSGSPFGFTGGLEGHTPTIQNDYQVATLDWRGMAHAFAVTYKEKKTCKGEHEIIKLVSSLMENMLADWQLEFAAQFYGSGTRLGNTAFHGLGSSIPTTPGTYAGISQSTYSNWANQAVDATGFAATPMAFLNQIKIACQKGEKGGRDRSMPDLFLGTSTDFRVVVDSLLPQLQLTDPTLAKAGFDNVLAHNVPFTWSEHADTHAANKIYCLNSKQFEFAVLGDEAVETGTEEHKGFPHGLTTGFAVALHQLINKNPRASGVLYNTGS